MFKNKILVIGIALLVISLTVLIGSLAIIYGDYNFPLLVDPILKEMDVHLALTGLGKVLPTFAIIGSIAGTFMVISCVD